VQGVEILAGWFRDVSDQIRSISLPILLLGVGFHTVETLLNAFAWRNVLRAAYPRSNVRFTSILGAYAGGTGLNTVLPAQGGTVAMVALFRAHVRGSTVLGLVGAGAVQSLFFGVVGALTCLILVASRPRAFDINTAWVSNHAWIALAGGLGVGAGSWIMARRYRTRLELAKEGTAMLRTPRRYGLEVLVPQVASYLLRIAVIATFMHAYDVPVTPRAALLIVAGNALTSTFAITPGGVGSQQALAAIALRNYAPSDVVTGFSLGQQLIISAWDLVFGLTLLWCTIGWRATQAFVHHDRPANRRQS
jgi:uncharacterized membrane protein YbhN (UPF0104 family)